MNLGRVGIWSTELRLADPGEISERAPPNSTNSDSGPCGSPAWAAGTSSATANGC